MASSAPPAFETLVAEAWPGDEWRDMHVLLAVSGGADSVALLRAFLACNHRCAGRGTLHVAHLNHSLRGDAADSDQAWVEELCRRLGVALSVGRADVARLATERGDGCEEAARTARYEFLKDTAESLGARYVATAHTADDQVETVLQRLFRGTGLAGLAGMPASRPLSPSVTLVRPLLGATRRDVLHYLTTIRQDYRTDESNADARFTRNRLRHEFLPLVRERFNADVDAAVLRLTKQAAEAQEWMSASAGRLADSCVVVEAADRLRISCRPLADQPDILVREVCKAAWQRAGWPLQAMGFQEWQQLAQLLGPGKDGIAANLPGGVRAHRSGNELVLARTGSFS